MPEGAAGFHAGALADGCLPQADSFGGEGLQLVGLVLRLEDVEGLGFSGEETDVEKGGFRRKERAAAFEDDVAKEKRGGQDDAVSGQAEAAAHEGLPEFAPGGLLGQGVRCGVHRRHA